MTVKKVILVGLIVLLLESLAGYIYLTYRDAPSMKPPAHSLLPSSSQAPQSTIPKRATLRLEASPSAVKTGATFKVHIPLNTFSSPISAADLTLKYDPSFVLVTATASAHPFSDSPIFEKTVFNEANEKTGIATLSAVIEKGMAFSGVGELTSLSFKAKKAGRTTITIVFTPGDTRDTNVVSDTRDILESVENLSLEILP